MVVCKFILLVFSGGDSLLFYLFTFLLIHLSISLFLFLFFFFFSDSVIIFVVIEIFFLGLCPRLDWEYLCLEHLGVLGQIDDCVNGFSQNPSFGQIGEF